MKRTMVVVMLVMLLVVSGVAFASEKGSGSASERTTGEADKVGIQAAMLEYIHTNTSPQTKTSKIGEVDAKFDYLHSGLKQKDGLYVSCVDFKAGSDVYDIDYYVEGKNGEYEVVKEILHKKNGETINKVFFQKDDKKDSGYEMKGSGSEKKGSGY